jgi:hypothetical protein
MEIERKFCFIFLFLTLHALNQNQLFMKKIFSFLMALAILVSTHASTPSVTFSDANTKPSTEVPVLNANQIMLPIGNTNRTISLMALSEISVKDFETISGKKLGFFDKISFKLGQKKLRDKIEVDGTIKSKAIKKMASKMAAEGEGFQIGGFALGLLLGLIGVLIAYLINDDKKSNRVKWAWIGWGVWVVILLIALAA